MAGIKGKKTTKKTTKTTRKAKTKELSFEESAREQAKQFAMKKNKMRLVKFLAEKEEAIRRLEMEVEEVLQECKKGDFSSLPELTKKQEEDTWQTVTLDNQTFSDWPTYGVDTYTVTCDAGVTTNATADTTAFTKLNTIADKIITN